MVFLSQIATMLLNSFYSKPQVDTTIAHSYTTSHTDGLFLPLTTDTHNLNCVICRTLDWTGGLVIKFPHLGALGLNNCFDEVTVLFGTNDLLFCFVFFVKTFEFYANVECTNYEIKCNTLSGGVLTQLDTLIKWISYTIPPVDSIVSQLNTLINTKQDTISTKLGDGVDLLFHQLH